MANTPTPGYYATRPKKRNELALLQLAKSADPEVSRLAKNSLIIGNEGFLRNFITKWLKRGSFIEFNYLLEEARIAFLTAIETYDLAYDVSIRTHARFQLMALFKKIANERKYADLDDEYVSDPAYIPNPDFKVFNLREVLFQALEDTLTLGEMEVVCLHYFEGLKKKKIAELRRCSEGRISAIVKKALLKVKKHLGNIGITPGFLELN